MAPLGSRRRDPGVLGTDILSNQYPTVHDGCRGTVGSGARQPGCTMVLISRVGLPLETGRYGACWPRSRFGPNESDDVRSQPEALAVTFRAQTATRRRDRDAI